MDDPTATNKVVLVSPGGKPPMAEDVLKRQIEMRRMNQESLIFRYYDQR